MYRKDGALHVDAEIPGLTDKDVEVTVTDDNLLIRGKKSTQSNVKEEDYYRSERHHGSFVRRLRLPSDADTVRAQATFKDGILSITIPLGEERSERRLEVKAG